MSRRRLFRSISEQTSALGWLRRCLGQNTTHPHAVVTGLGQQHMEVHMLGARQFGPTQWPNGFTPTEGFFDSFANPLTDPVPLMASGLPIG